MSERDSGITFVIGDVQIWIHFEPRDMWFGVYWNKEQDYNEIYVCLVPMLPIRFLWAAELTEETKKNLDDRDFEDDYK